MHGERGQATIEWMGALLAVAIALTGLMRLASRVDAAGPATSLVHAITCAAKGGCAERGADGAPRTGERAVSSAPPGLPRTDRGRAGGGPAGHAVTAPPLVPLVPADRHAPSRRRILARVPGAGGGRARRAARLLWRRAWLLCLGYERVRYGLVHPETRVRQAVPLAGALQMVNDCASPIDFARDWHVLPQR